jgi:hypothetical protein
MADESQDIFGKIDAMLGKRAGFGGRKPDAEDDFPLLTEVVSEGVKAPRMPAADALSSPAGLATEAEPVEPGSHMSEVDIDRLAAALEARLSELFIRQQLRIESLVRRIVREELDARKD